MRVLAGCFIVVFVALSISAASAREKTCDLERAKTQTDMNLCAGKNFGMADEELNRVYRKVLALYKDDPAFIEKLQVAQKAWIKFRDAQLDMMYPPHKQPYYYGSAFPMCSSIYMESLTRDRIRTLEQWLKGTEEGDVCSGSMKLGGEVKK